MLSAEYPMDFRFAVYDSETNSVVSSVTITSTDLHLGGGRIPPHMQPRRREQVYADAESCGTTRRKPGVRRRIIKT